MKHVHDRKADVETYEIGQFKRPHRMIGAQFQRGVDAFDCADVFVQHVDRFVDHRYQYAVDDEGWKNLSRG